MRTLSGLRSRWTAPAAWIATSAFATSRPDVAAQLLGHAAELVEERAQRPSLDVLHDEEVDGAAVDVDRVGVERRDDVLVADALADLRLAQEPLEEAAPRQEVRVDHLDGDSRRRRLPRG